MTIDPRSFNFAKAPWCLSEETAVAGEADDLRRWFLHQCGCPTVQILTAAALISHEKCGYPAFAATPGSPRKIFAEKETRTDSTAYDTACAGFSTGIVWWHHPARVEGVRRTKTLTVVPDGDYIQYNCAESIENISDPPEEYECNKPSEIIETDSFVIAYGYDCLPVEADRETLRVVAGGATATPSTVWETPAADTETERVNSIARTTYTNTAEYTETISTPVYTAWPPCGDVLHYMDDSTTTHTLPGDDTVCVTTNHDVLSEEVEAATVTAMSFARNPLYATAYGPVQTDSGLALEQQVSVALILKNLLKGVRYTVRLRTARRTRTLNSAGTGFDVGDWALYGDDTWDFTADATEMLLGGEWLPEGGFDADAVQLEHIIPEGAPNFRTVAEAEADNASANVRATYVLGDGTPGFEYRVWEALVYPKIGVHTHTDGSAA